MELFQIINMQKGKIFFEDIPFLQLVANRYYLINSFLLKCCFPSVISTK